MREGPCSWIHNSVKEKFKKNWNWMACHFITAFNNHKTIKLQKKNVGDLLAYYQTEEAFLISESNYMYEFSFSFEENLQLALKVLENDENLAKLRSKLVPRK